MLATFNLSAFGSKLESIRLALNLTRIDVASLSNLSKDTIYKIEKGMVIPKYDTLEMLSSIYKEDLLSLLIHHRTSSHFYQFNQYVDQLIYDSNSEVLSRLHNEFLLIKSNIHKDLLPILTSSLEQYTSFIMGLELFSSEQYEPSLQNLELALKLKNAHFTVDSWRSFKYDTLEIRILFLLSLCLAELKEYNRSNDILHHILCYFTDIESSDAYNHFMIIKCYYCISYNYHNLNELDLVIEITDAGIKYCNQNHMSFRLPHLLYRRGIAQFLKKDKDYLKTLKASITLLRITGHHSLAEQFIKISEKQYALNLSEN